MRKASILVIVALLAIAGIMAISAYTSASVNNGFQFSVVSTNEALLALKAGSHDAASYKRTTSKGKTQHGSLNLDLDTGYGGGSFGVQKDSTYIWEKLFAVKNNSENPIRVTFTLDKKEGKGIWLKQHDDDWKWGGNDNGGGGQRIDHTGWSFKEYTVNLDPNQEIDIDLALKIAIQVSRIKNEPFKYTLIVDAESIVDPR